MESSAENSPSMVAQSDKNITKMMIRQKKNAMTARLEPKRVKGKAPRRPIQEELNDNPYNKEKYTKVAPMLIKPSEISKGSWNTQL